MTPALEGRTILITRPAHSDPALPVMLRRHGASVCWRPALTIDRSFEMPELERAVSTINSFSWIVFTSVNAVASIGASLRKRGIPRSALAGVRVAAVGPTTARAVLRLGLRVAAIADPHTAAGLLTALQPHVRSGDPVLYPRAASVSGVLADGLRASGVTVTDPVAYRTLPIAIDRRSPRASTAVDCTVFCSPSAVSAFARSRTSVPSSVIACIGPATARAARHEGLEVQIIPQHSTGDALAQAIVDYYATRCS